MSYMYTVVMRELIRNEINNDGYCNEHDKTLLADMCAEINELLGTNIHYIVEINFLKLPGAGEIIRKYIERFQTERIKAYCISSLISDRVKGREALILDMYKSFKNSDVYISPPNKTAPADIVARYDNALMRTRSKAVQRELVSIVSNPRDAFYLPLTRDMLARRKYPEIRERSEFLIHSENIDNESIGLPRDNNDVYYPSLEGIRRQLIFNSMICLKEFPSEKTLSILSEFEDNPDKDIRTSAIKCITVVKQKLETSKDNA